MPAVLLDVIKAMIYVFAGLSIGSQWRDNSTYTRCWLYNLHIEIMFKESYPCAQPTLLLPNSLEIKARLNMDWWTRPWWKD